MHPGRHSNSGNDHRRQSLQLPRLALIDEDLVVRTSAEQSRYSSADDGLPRFTVPSPQSRSNHFPVLPPLRSVLEGRTSWGLPPLRVPAGPDASSSRLSHLTARHPAPLERLATFPSDSNHPSQYSEKGPRCDNVRSQTWGLQPKQHTSHLSQSSFEPERPSQSRHLPNQIHGAPLPNQHANRHGRQEQPPFEFDRRHEAPLRDHYRTRQSDSLPAVNRDEVPLSSWSPPHRPHQRSTSAGMTDRSKDDWQYQRAGNIGRSERLAGGEGQNKHRPGLGQHCSIDGIPVWPGGETQSGPVSLPTDIRDLDSRRMGDWAEEKHREWESAMNETYQQHGRYTRGEVRDQHGAFPPDPYRHAMHPDPSSGRIQMEHEDWRTSRGVAPSSIHADDTRPWGRRSSNDGGEPDRHEVEWRTAQSLAHSGGGGNHNLGRNPGWPQRDSLAEYHHYPADHSGGSSSDTYETRLPLRQPIACFPCRTRKLRCDGVHPCAQCVRRKGAAECKFAPEVRRRGKAKTMSSDAGNVEDGDGTSGRAGGKGGETP